MRKALFLAAALLLTSPAHAADQQTEVLAQYGLWEVGYDFTVARCYAQSATEGSDHFMRYGFGTSDDGSAFFLFYDASWNSLVAGAEYNLSLKIDNLRGWEGAAEAWHFYRGGKALHVFVNVELIREFMAGDVLRVFYKGAEIAQFNLNGSRQAAKAVNKCEFKVRARDAAEDPFTDGPKRKASDDPFEQGS